MNADFSAEPLQKAFDWRMAAAEGVSSGRLAENGIEFSLNGKQPENLDLLVQMVPLRAGTRHRLIVQYMTPGISAPTGFVWLVDPAAKPPLLAAAEDWTEHRLTFEAPASGLAVLRLCYRRPLGSVRAQGQLLIRSVRLEPDR